MNIIEAVTLLKENKAKYITSDGLKPYKFYIYTMPKPKRSRYIGLPPDLIMGCEDSEDIKYWYPSINAFLDNSWEVIE